MIVKGDLRGWTDDAVAAMTASPGYFDWWDRWKTRALVIALGVLAFKIARR